MKFQSLFTHSVDVLMPYDLFQATKGEIKCPAHDGSE